MTSSKRRRHTPDQIIAVRRGRIVHFERADVLLKRLKSTHLDNSSDLEVR